METVLFLDIDGVLNSNFWNDSHQKEISDGTLIDEEKVRLLACLVKKTRSKIILHSGWRAWFWLFAGAGIIFLIFSLKLSGVASILCGVTAFSCFWSILEGHSGKFVYSPSGITVYEYRVNKRSVFMLPEQLQFLTAEWNALGIIVFFIDFCILGIVLCYKFILHCIFIHLPEQVADMFQHCMGEPFLVKDILHVLGVKLRSCTNRGKSSIMRE